MHRPCVRQIEPSRIIGAVDRNADSAGTAQMRLQHLFESIHPTRAVELGGPPQPEAAREALACPVDVHQSLRLQSPRLDEVVEAQCAVDDQNRVLDDDVAMLLKSLFIQADFEAGAAAV